MNGRFLLDSNIIIGIFAQDALIHQHLSGAAEVFIPSIVLGELYYGAYKSSRAEANLMRVDELALRNTVLVCDTATAKQYGFIKNQLKIKGRPIPENDIWIAATALQYNLTLATRDEHFREIDNLLIATW